MDIEQRLIEDGESFRRETGQLDYEGVLARLWDRLGLDPDLLSR